MDEFEGIPEFEADDEEDDSGEGRAGASADDAAQAAAEAEAAMAEAAALRRALEASTAANREALEHLKTVLLAGQPEVAPEQVTGDSAAEVEASFAAALRLVERVRRKVREEAAAAIPAGAPGRSQPGPRSALEKIRAGLGRA